MSRPSLTIELDEQERKKLKKQVNKTKERKIADRIRVILYKDEGLDNQEIASRLQMGRNQVTKILHLYTEGGLARLQAPDDYRGSAPKLTPEQQMQLRHEVTTNIYISAMAVIEWVSAQWEICYSVRGMHGLLKRLGFTYKKNRLVPSKADPNTQEQFIRWFQGLRERMGPDDLLFFGDAVHFKHNAEAGYAWSPSGKPHLIPSNSGRQRYNVLGAYDPQTQASCILLTEASINQGVMGEFLAQLRTEFPDAQRVYLILDNASYNHAHSVKDKAAQLGIALDYLPPYSPNLNPIERLWKFVRKKFFKDRYRHSFEKFCRQLEAFFDNLDDYAEQLRSLITENFQRIPNGWANP